ncbi:hypothetical protein DWY69_20020 [Eisenbergiella massiliensis]|uniref:Uncharacterized protein n=1 Tax=Eisenbergiella massiliensis TaxID=1720294 RepID=A0A3E3IN86_9FIRM|nr:hypothetical protein DWY69_20020 [Eisenbergiella massiliensis]
MYFGADYGCRILHAVFCMPTVSNSRRGLPVRPENIFPDMLPAGFCFILAQSVRFYHLVLHLLLSSPSLYFTPRASAVALF